MKYKCNRCGFSSTAKSTVQRHTCTSRGLSYGRQYDSTGFDILEIMAVADFISSTSDYSPPAYESNSYTSSDSGSSDSGSSD